MDAFARSLLEEAKRFLEKTADDDISVANTAHLHAALMLAFCSLEAHINAISDDFLSRPELSVHERSVLEEKEVRLEEGEFVMRNNLKMVRMEDRIKLLHVKFGKPIDVSSSCWSRLGEAIHLRNELTHPKEEVKISKKAVARALQAIIDMLDELYMAIYKRPFPPSGRGLQSTLNF
jgi:hypothetical protein